MKELNFSNMKGIKMKMWKMFVSVMIVVCFLFGEVLPATSASDISFESSGPGENINLHQVSGQLFQAPNYEWWYGCSPTAAGMMMGYYDREGYDELMLGGMSELNTFPSNPGWWDYKAQNTIASVGHVFDYYSAGFGGSGDDFAVPSHSFNCLADFMGTSQDNLSMLYGGNSNGATTFFYYTNNTPLNVVDLEVLGSDYYDISGMYGIDEYLEYSGYDSLTLYNQYIFGHNGVLEGFTLEQYKDEIDAGRPVLIHVEGHSMFGYGYIDGTDIINVFDTWIPDGENPGTMVWGGSYPYGPYSLQHYGVTVMTIPEPATVVILGLGGLFLLVHRSKDSSGGNK